MKKFSKFILLTVILVSLMFPLKSADALIPFEFTIPETVGKIGTWVQEKLAWVQLQISSITESKVARRIGDGMRAIREVRGCIRKVYRGQPVNELADYYRKFEFSNNDPCKKYVDKYPFLANVLRITGQTQRIIGEIKNEDAYLIMDAARNIAEDGARIAELEEFRKRSIEELEYQAEIDKTTIEAKIKIAEKDLELMKTEHAAMQDTADVFDKKIMLEEEARMVELIADLKIQKAAIEPKLINDKLVLNQNIGAEIAELIKRRAENSKILEGLRDRIKQGIKEEADKRTGLEIALKAKQDYSVNNTTNDTMQEQLRRTQAIRKDITKSDIAALNESNNNIAYAYNPANNPEIDTELGGTTEGKSETLQASIDNTLRQIEVIEKIIKMELTSLEMQTKNIISQNINHRLDHQQENSLIIDFCRYQEGRNPKNSKHNNNKNKSEDNKKNDNDDDNKTEHW